MPCSGEGEGIIANTITLKYNYVEKIAIFLTFNFWLVNDLTLFWLMLIIFCRICIELVTVASAVAKERKQAEHCSNECCWPTPAGTNK